MKINIQKNKDSKIYQVEIPSTVDLSHVAKGELFPIFITDEKGISKEMESCYLADGRSLLINHKVIRFSHSQVSKKGERYRFGIQTEGFVTQNHVTAHIVRPVKARASSSSLGGGEMKSPMTGKVVSISVKNNSKVKEGDTLIIIEAMKMENRIIAECNGVVSNIKVIAGTSISAGDPLLSIIPEMQG